MNFPGPLIGVIHLLPLPGSPGARRMADVVGRAVLDARAYADAGLHALVVENYGDAPFWKEEVGPAAVAGLALCADAVRRAVSLPLGINVLRNDARAALGVAAATGADFIRVNVHAGVVATDQGLLEGRAAETVRERAQLRAKVAIAADVHVKHGRTLHCDDIGEAARDLMGRAAADAVIVTGPATGRAATLEDLKRVRKAILRRPLIAGSGVTEESVREILTVADAVIVGTALKRGGRTSNPVDPERAAAFVKAAL